LDNEDNIYNFRARLFACPACGDTETGIFYGADPAGQGFAHYAYCGNNPITRIDKDGRVAWFIPIICEFVASYVSSGQSSGDWGWKSLRAGLESGISAAVGYQFTSWGTLAAGKVIGTMVGGAASGTMESILSGDGNIGSDAALGAAGGLLGGLAYNNMTNDPKKFDSNLQFIGALAFASAASGMISDMASGENKFWNSFSTAAVGGATTAWGSELADYIEANGKMKALAAMNQNLAVLKIDLAYGMFQDWTYNPAKPGEELAVINLHKSLYPRNNSMISLLSRFKVTPDDENIRFDDLHFKRENGIYKEHFDKFSLVTNPILHGIVDELWYNDIQPWIMHPKPIY
jgi:RHS repeat-associated protein